MPDHAAAGKTRPEPTEAVSSQLSSPDAQVDSDASTLTDASRKHVNTPVVIPDHELIRQIGSGSYGEVWLAKNAVDTLRAVKIVHRRNFEQEEHFEREFKGLQRFEPISRSHDGFVDVLQLGRNDGAGYFYYVMELADAVANPKPESRTEVRNPKSKSDSGKAKTGTASRRVASDFGVRQSGSYLPRTLRHDLKQHGSLPVDQCVQVGLALTAALEQLHSNGLVHRDIKPSNIIFVNGAPKLADIGLVTDIDEARSMVGTAGYIPPEGPGAPQADIYSLGKVLYEISLGKDRHEFPQLPPDLQTRPEYAALLELNEVVIKACESDPRKRYQSAAELGADLELLHVGKSVKRKRTRQHQWAIAKKLGLAAAALALLTGALIFFKGHTPNPEAVREYALGRYFYNKQLSLEAHKKAMEHLNKAIKADPKYVEPYGELIAICIWGQQGVFGSVEEKERKTKEIADKLLALDPKLAEGHTALSEWKFQQHDWRGAEDEIVRAIKLNPNYFIARELYVFYLCMLGRADEAQRQAERALEVDPTGRTTGLVAAWPFIAARQFDKAIAQLQKVIELEENFLEAYTFLGRCYEAQSNYVAAIEAWRKDDLLPASGNDAAKVNAGYDALLQAYNSNGQEGYWRKQIELINADKLLPESERLFYEANLAGCYARLGEKEKAIEELEKHHSYDHQLKFEPLYDTLHDEPRFKDLLKRAGLEK